MKLQIYMTMIALLTCLSGYANQFADWEKDHFFQGNLYFDDVDDPQHPKQIIKRNIRSLRVYDEFDTLGLFDVLLLSDEVRHAYTELHAHRKGYSPDAYQQLVKRQQAEAGDALSFYVIAYAPGTTMPLDEEGNANWCVLLKGPHGLIRPRSVRTVDLDPEYKYLLGNFLSKHKTVYLVKFEKPSQPFELVFTLPDRNACVTWEKPTKPMTMEPKKKKRVKPKRETCAPGGPVMERASQELVV